MREKPLISIDASRANSLHRTGTEWYSFHLIQQLKKLIPNTYDVVLYSKEELRNDLKDLPPNWKSKVLSWSPRFLWTQLRLSIEMIITHPDLLFVPAHTIPLIHPKKIVAVIHDIGFERQDELYSDNTIGYSTPLAKKALNVIVRLFTLGRYGTSERDYHRFSVRLACHKATKIITVSEFSKKEIQDVFGVRDDKIRVVHNGLNMLQDENMNFAAVQKRFGIRKPYILFLGRIEQKKNVPRLVEAFAVLQKKYNFEGQLVLVGEPGYQYETVQQKIDKNHLRSLVIETGWTNGNDLGTIMHNAEIFILPSLYEGFGIPILEAMQMGVPVVCSNIPALLEIGADGAKYFDPESSNDIALQMNSVLTNETQREELIEKGKHRASQFSWIKTGRETWSVIQECLTNNE